MYKTATMDLSSAITAILGLGIGIEKLHMPYIGHRVVRRGLI